MAIVVTDIGTSLDRAGATVTITGVTVPAGSLIVALVNEASGVLSGGTFGDGTNSYTSVALFYPNNTDGNSTGQFFYAWNTSAISSATLTYTKQISGDDAVISVFYATGIQTSSNPLDTAVTATAGGGSGTTSTVTSGTPVVSGELFVGGGIGSGGLTFTQDSTNGAYAAPPDYIHIAGGFVAEAGGFLVNTGSAALTYAPVIGNSNWGLAIIGFKPGPTITDVLMAQSWL